MAKNEIIVVKGTPVTMFKPENQDYISLTDIASNKNPDEPKDVVKNLMHSRTSIEFLGLWKQLNDSDFKGVELDFFLFEAGSISFTLSPSKWIEATDAKGLSQSERVKQLTQIAITQMKSLVPNKQIKRLK
jgi:hypothetical protein